jgi:hypothetical protein
MVHTDPGSGSDRVTCTIQTGTITSSDVIVTTRQLARYTQTWVGWYYTTITIAAHWGARSAEKNTSGALKVWNQSLSK